MAAPSNISKDYSWETELAPKISRSYITTVALIFTVWMISMTYIAYHRWFGALQ